MSRQLICDRCNSVSGKTKTGSADPPEWKKVSYSIVGFKVIKHDICPNCSSALKFNEAEETLTTSVEDQLYDIISELVTDAMDNH